MFPEDLLCAGCLAYFRLTQSPIVHREPGWVLRQSGSRRPLRLSSKLPWPRAGAPGPPPHPAVTPHISPAPRGHDTKTHRTLLHSSSSGVRARVLARTPPALPTPSSLYSGQAGLLLSWKPPGTAACFTVTALAVPSACDALPLLPSSLHAKVTSSVKTALITQLKRVTS